MGELKRVFSQAKMNKDMDERLVPNGQYRDANNIEITTSEASEVGTVQTLFGNTERNQVLQDSSSLNNVIDYTTTTATIGGDAFNLLGPHNRSTVVGSVANVNTDKLYYLVSGGDNSNSNVLFANTPTTYASVASHNVTNNIAKDYILEYDTVHDVHRYVFVDIYKVYTDVQANNSLADTAEGSTTFHVSAQAGQSAVPPGIRPGMAVTAIDVTQQDDFGSIVIDGDVTARNYIVSSSIAYMTQSFSSGSTIFGNTPADDTHQFTGSVFISGSGAEGVGGLTVSTGDGVIFKVGEDILLMVK